jgi:Spy/CpxP family protein refolding chaperone
LALNLTTEQREKLRPIVNDEGEQLSAVRLDEHVAPEQKRAKLLEIRESFRPKIAEVLTPEQQEKWKKMEDASQPQPRATSGDTGKAPPKPQ